MLECLVFGRRAATDINERLASQSDETVSALPHPDRRPVVSRDFSALRKELQQTMND